MKLQITLGSALPLSAATFAVATLMTAQQPASGDDEQVFQLSPFVVTAADDSSYLAKNAVSATKFNTALKDIPISLQVMTESFMQDTFSKNLESVMEFAAAVTETAETRETGVFSIRGFRTSRSKRDGVVAYYGQDMTNVERVEVMKGPASLLYGQTEPGGIINYVPKRPFDQPRYGITLSAGSDGYYRAEMEATGPLIKSDAGQARLLYRLDASYEEQDGWKASAAHDRNFISPVLEWRLTQQTKLTIQYERHEHNRITQHGFSRGSRFAREQWLAAEDTPSPNDLKSAGAFTGGQSGYLLLLADSGLPVLVSPDPTTPGRFSLGNLPGVRGDPRWDDGNGFLRDNAAWFVFNPSTPSTSPVVLVVDELANVPYNFVPEHPDDFNRMQRDFFSLDFQSPLPWPSWFIRVVGVHDNPRLDIQQTVPLPIATYSGDGLRYTRFNFSSTEFENKLNHYQVNITGKWELGRMHNQTIIGGEFIDDSYRNRIWGALPPAEVDLTGERLRLTSGLSLPFLSTNRVFDINASNVRDRNELLPSSRSLKNESQGFYVSNLSSFWNDQIKLLTGLRYGRAKTINYVANSAGAPTVPAWGEVNSVTPTSSKYSPQVGIIYAPRESLSFYVSYSESFWPTSTLLDRVNDSGTAIEPLVPASPLEGLGKEIGMKVDLWESKLSGTIAVFEIERRNIITREPSDDPRFPNQSIEVQGAVETSRGIDLDLIFSPLPNLQFVVGYAYIETDVALGVNDFYKDAVGIPKHNATFWGKYTFVDGPLDGFAVGLGLNYVSSRRMFAPLRQFLDRGLENVNIYDDGYLLSSLMLSYTTDWIGTRATFSINVRNLGDVKAFGGNAMPITPRQIFFSAKFNF